ncbi:hypothetical protein F5883DRAFT_577123 [Diaporthe sp. PMI_573]|nr:hypothetical protein F5883DRAFT_577123 [Diaporthaceae sp. PMI_573]
MNAPCRLFFPRFPLGLPCAIEPNRGNGFGEWAQLTTGLLWVGTWKRFRVAPKDRLSKKQLCACALNCNVGFEQMKRADGCRVQRKIFMSWLSRSHSLREDAPVVSVAVSVCRPRRLLLHEVFGGMECSVLSQSNPSFRIAGTRSNCPDRLWDTGAGAWRRRLWAVVLLERSQRLAAQTASTGSRAVLVQHKLAMMSSLKRLAQALAGVSKVKGADWRFRRASQTVLGRGASRSRNAV